MPSNINQLPQSRWPTATYQAGRFHTMHDDRHEFYGPDASLGDDGLGIETWQSVGDLFYVSSPQYAVGCYFSGSESSIRQQVRALGKAYRDLLMRQDPLGDGSFSTNTDSGSSRRARAYSWDGRGQHEGAVRCKDHFLVAQKLLAQLAQPQATNQAQEILVELSAMSLAAAGFQGYSHVGSASSSDLIGEPKGFHGRALSWYKRPFVHKDLKPLRVERHMALLNAVKEQGVDHLKTAINKAGLSAEQYAEQLIHRGKMFIVCAPTALLHQHSDVVVKLATAVDAVDGYGVGYGVALHEKARGGNTWIKERPPLAHGDDLIVALESCLKEAEPVLFPSLALNAVPVR